MLDRSTYIELGFNAIENEVSAEQDLSRLLEEVIGNLHPEYRKAVELKWGLDRKEERSYAQVAREMGVSKSTARRRVLAAKKALNIHPKTGRALRDYIEE